MNNIKIVYLHGFASCGRSRKSTLLAEKFSKNSVWSPDLPLDPAAVIELIEKRYAKEGIDILVGSSLGGFYAHYFAEHFALPAVLINPSIYPWETLAPYVGKNRRFCDNAIFHFHRNYLEKLKTMKKNPYRGRYLVLLQSGDEVLDYRNAYRHFRNERVIVEKGGNHRFENLEDYLEMIENFLKKDGIKL